MRGSVSPDSIDLTRREAIARAILLVGGVAVAPVACAPPAERGFFGPRERAVLEPLCETILPTTDTPGARAADVHGFIDGMMQRWASTETQGRLREVVARVDRAARGTFTGMDERRREALVERIDAESFAAKDPAWLMFKRLVLLGYYSSEIGASQELAYLPVPGEWRPDVPVTAATRTWAE